jgi:hypothetical protein
MARKEITVSEAKRYYVNLDHGTRYSPVDGCDQAMNKADDFDRVTAERDAANECKDLATEQRDLAQAQAEMFFQKQRSAEIQLKNSNSKIDALQARLTAADERSDRLEGLLRRVIDSGQLLSASSVGEALEEDIDAELKPAEPSTFTLIRLDFPHLPGTKP